MVNIPNYPGQVPPLLQGRGVTETYWHFKLRNLTTNYGPRQPFSCMFCRLLACPLPLNCQPLSLKSTLTARKLKQATVCSMGVIEFVSPMCIKIKRGLTGCWHLLRLLYPAIPIFVSCPLLVLLIPDPLSM